MTIFYKYCSQKPQVDNTGRFGIGTTFIQPLDEPGQTAALTISPPSTPIYDATTPGDPFTSPVEATTSPIAAMSPPQPSFTIPKPGTIGPSLLPVMSPTSSDNSFNGKTTKPPKTGNTNRHCEICDISVTSDQQMETHINGQKHQKKCKQIGENSRVL